MANPATPTPRRRLRYASLMAMHTGKRRLRRTLGLVFGLVGAVIMSVDSLEHIRRGFVGLSAIFIVLGGLLSAGLGVLIGIAIERARERRGPGSKGSTGAGTD